MDTAIARSKYLRISAQKARLAAGLIRNLSVDEALAQLMFSNVKGGRLLIKTLNSAIANAEWKFEAPREELRVLEVRVDEGPQLKRARPKNKGGRHQILKRTSHFTVAVGR